MQCASLLTFVKVTKQVVLINNKIKKYFKNNTGQERYYYPILKTYVFANYSIYVIFSLYNIFSTECKSNSFSSF